MQLNFKFVSLGGRNIQNKVNSYQNPQTVSPQNIYNDPSIHTYIHRNNNKNSESHAHKKQQYIDLFTTFHMIKYSLDWIGLD